MNSLIIADQDAASGLLDFAQSLVRIPSYSGQEEPIVRFLAARMQALGYDEVRIDRYGSVIGRIGSGPKVIFFDSHVDTVKVLDADQWAVPPFGGEIRNGYLWGRGSVDMKSSAAASVYAAAAARDAGLLAGKTVYVSCSVFEEDCDGEAVKRFLQESGLRPDFAVICEPSSNRITTGHKGKAQVIIRTAGVSAHGSAPEKGVNAVYEMAEIIQRVDAANQKLMQPGGRTGTLVLSQISSSSVSLNAVPYACEIYLDRRTVVGESEERLRAEMDALVAGKNAAWQLGTLQRVCWTGEPLTYEPLHLAWEISPDHELTRAFIAAYRQTSGRAPASFDYWDFSTNAVATVALGIPTIGFGPGEHKLAHMRDEKCPTAQILEASLVYANAIGLL